MTGETTTCDPKTTGLDEDKAGGRKPARSGWCPDQGSQRVERRAWRVQDLKRQIVRGDRASRLAHTSAQLLGAQEVCEAPTEQKWGQTGGVTNVNTLKSLEGLQEVAASGSSHIS